MDFNDPRGKQNVEGDASNLIGLITEDLLSSAIEQDNPLFSVD